MRSIGQFFKDLINNINWARIGLGIDVKDPWIRREVEDELHARNINYIYTYSQDDCYTYAIIGGKKESIADFVNWFKKHEDWKYYISKHSYFKTEIVYLTL